MQSQEIARQLQKLKDLIGRTHAACGGDIEMQSHWAKYLCVLAAGFLENAISEIYIDFVRNAASPAVTEYASRHLRKIQNPKGQIFIETAKSFDRTWSDDLEAYLNQEGRKEAIDSIMANRHLIAHGKDSSITMVRVKEYLEKAVAVVEFIEQQCRK